MLERADKEAWRYGVGRNARNPPKHSRRHQMSKPVLVQLACDKLGRVWRVDHSDVMCPGAVGKGIMQRCLGFVGLTRPERCCKEVDPILRHDRYPVVANEERKRVLERLVVTNKATPRLFEHFPDPRHDFLLGESLVSHEATSGQLAGV